MMNMKKVYQTPATKAVLLLSTNAIMAGSPPSGGIIDIHGGTGTPGQPE